MTTQNQIEIFAAVSAALSAKLKELNAQCEKARSAETGVRAG
jgi:ABC-type molybdate transport system substrate-binding protein